MKSQYFDKKTLFSYLIIAILVIVLLLQRCGSGGTISPTKSDTVTTVKYIPITKIITQYTPKYITKIKRDTTYFNTIQIDTAYVIGDYYSTYFYNDTIKQDTSLTLYIKDSVTENKIKTRDITYTYKQKITTNTVIKNKAEFYVGLGLTGSKTGINYFGTNLLLRTKKKQVYGVGVGIDGDFNPQLNLQTYWKIGKK